MSLEVLFALPSTARVTTFFLSLASTNPPLSEQGRSFGLFLPHASLDALRKTLGGFGSHSLEIFLSAPLKRLFRVALPGFIQALFRAPHAAGLFIPSPCWRAEKSIKTTPLVNFFRYVFAESLSPILSRPSITSKL